MSALGVVAIHLSRQGDSVRFDRSGREERGGRECGLRCAPWTLSARTISDRSIRAEKGHALLHEEQPSRSSLADTRA